MIADQEQGVVTGINVTPLVDIMLVLLIVFMVTAHFVADSGLKVNLPKAEAADAVTAPSLLVTLAADGAIFLKDAPVGAAALEASLRRESQANPNVRVTLAADEALPYRKVVEMLDAIKKSGVTRVALASQR